MSNLPYSKLFWTPQNLAATPLPSYNCVLLLEFTFVTSSWSFEWKILETSQEIFAVKSGLISKNNTASSVRGIHS